jgi:hypothetical protein
MDPIKPMLPNKPRGVRRVNDRRVLNGIFWVLRSGAPWRDLPEASTFPDHALTPRRGRPPVSKPQKIVDLALSPAMILDCECIDASIDADVANKELRALDKVRYLINRSPAEATCGGCHRRAPSLLSQRYLAFKSPIRKWPDLKSGCDLLENTTGDLIFMGTAIVLFIHGSTHDNAKDCQSAS